MKTVLYHRDNDGFGAAYALWSAFGNEANYVSVQYGEPLPELPEGTTSVFIVDFSYDKETCLALQERFGEGNVWVLDHHKTAEAELKDLPFAHFDMSKSGAMLAWAFANAATAPPDIIRYVQDYDLWKFELDDSEEVNLYISSLPWDFDAWDSFDLDTAKEAGKAISAFRAGQLKGTVRDSKVEDFLGYAVPVVNCSANISKAGHELLEAYPNAPFAVLYCDRKDGLRSYSLRSRGGFDVSELAKEHGGGGHKAAAGFTKPAPQVI